MNPTLKRKRIGDLDPWIETLIQNYGKDQNKVLKAQVTDVSEMSESQRLEEDDNCFLFVSDGIAVIPAVLSDDAWELLLDFQEDLCLSELPHAIVLLNTYELTFDMREELNACQFYLKVDHLSIIGITPNRLKLYSCSFIPSVRAQIETVWRFHLENSIPNSAEAGLVSFMDAWYDLQDQELQEIQEETEEEMETSVPETSLCVQTFIEMEIKECVKAWSDLHDTLEEADEEVETSQPDLSVEETLHRGQEKFVVPVSFLIIPEEQRALLTADASAESEMPNSLAPPLEEPHPVSGDQTEAVQDGVELLSADVEPSALEHTQSDPNQESQSLLKEVHPIATRAQISTGITLSQMPKPTLFSPSRSAERPIIEFSLEQNKEVFPSLPSWLGHNTTLSNEHEAPTSREPPNLPISPKTKRRKVHSDGTPFFYTYQPKPRVAKALSLLQIPGHLLQWAVRYLGTSDGAETSTGAGS